MHFLLFTNTWQWYLFVALNYLNVVSWKSIYTVYGVPGGLVYVRFQSLMSFYLKQSSKIQLDLLVFFKTTTILVFSLSVAFQVKESHDSKTNEETALWTSGRMLGSPGTRCDLRLSHFKKPRQSSLPLTLLGVSAPAPPTAWGVWGPEKTS